MSRATLLFAPVVFLAAFLLFQVQPLVGKYVLPWFGGGPAVWTACLLFFQAALLCGYAYAHLVATRLRPRGQAVVHLLLLGAAVAVLPLAPGERWRPPDPASPTPRILAMLAATVGLPAVALAATAPLAQAWFARLWPGASPYRLYALSNAGSLIALVSYPLVVEPNLSRRHQGILWSASLAAFAFLCGALSLLQARRSDEAAPSSGATAGGEETAADARTVTASPPPHMADAGAAANERPSWSARSLWFALPAAASVVLAGTTNTLTQNVAPVPFLWVLPLALYLLTFVVCFDHPRWYRRSVFATATVPAAALFAWLELRTPGGLAPAWHVGLYCLVLTVCCMTCHGELARLRPPPRWLTTYFLATAAGGAAGGAFASLVAPRLFDRYAEVRWGVWVACALLLVVLALDGRSRLYRLRPAWLWVVAIAGVMLLGAALATDTDAFAGERRVARHRNFYGVVTVAEVGDRGSPDHHVQLRHGGIVHGLQYPDAARRRRPLAYYGPHGGLDLAIAALRRRRPSLRIGVVGLGAGTVAAYGRGGDVMRMYEIDPDVERVARAHFTYLRDTPAAVSVALGDGRLSLERETDRAFDALVLDAFSADSIPVHLLTREAFDAYRRHVRPGGVIAINVTNKYLDLAPVVGNLAHHFGLSAFSIDHEPDVADGCPTAEYPSRWVLMSDDPTYFHTAPVAGAGVAIPPAPAIGLWTDDRADLLAVLRRSKW